MLEAQDPAAAPMPRGPGLLLMVLWSLQRPSEILDGRHPSEVHQPTPGGVGLEADGPSPGSGRVLGTRPDPTGIGPQSWVLVEEGGGIAYALNARKMNNIDLSINIMTNWLSVKQ